MTFNNEFGILTNWQRALFLRSAETSDRKTPEDYFVKLDGPGQPISMLKAWVMVLLVEDDWPPPDRNFGISTSAWSDQIRAVGDAQGCHMQMVVW
jgi:hypothetical protein